MENKRRCGCGRRYSWSAGTPAGLLLGYRPSTPWKVSPISSIALLRRRMRDLVSDRGRRDPWRLPACSVLVAVLQCRSVAACFMVWRHLCKETALDDPDAAFCTHAPERLSAHSTCREFDGAWLGMGMIEEA